MVGQLLHDDIHLDVIKKLLLVLHALYRESEISSSPTQLATARRSARIVPHRL